MSRVIILAFCLVISSLELTDSYGYGTIYGDVLNCFQQGLPLSRQNPATRACCGQMGHRIQCKSYEGATVCLLPEQFDHVWVNAQMRSCCNQKGIRYHSLRRVFQLGNCDGSRPQPPPPPPPPPPKPRPPPPPRPRPPPPPRPRPPPPPPPPKPRPPPPPPPPKPRPPPPPPPPILEPSKPMNMTGSCNRECQRRRKQG